MTQPGGGFGTGGGSMPAHARPKNRGTQVMLGVLAAIVVIAGIMWVVLHRYVGRAKNAEAIHQLTTIGQKAKTAYAREKRICPSASEQVPANSHLPKPCSGALTGIYQSTLADWAVDQDRKAGFSCLEFEIVGPQWFQYEYTATETGFRAHAQSCYEGLSSWEVTGTLHDGQLEVTEPREL